MKKILVTLLLLTMLTSVPVMAANNLADMALNELIKLQTDIQTELLARKENKQFEVPVGVYVIGVDVPAGVYSMELAEVYKKRSAAIYTHKSEPDRKSGGYDDAYYLEPSRGVNVIGKIILYEAELLEITHCPVLFKLYTGIGL